MIRLPKFTTSVYGLLLWRLLLSLAALTFARVVFLVFNTDLLHLGKTALWPAFAGGLRFDLAALVYLNAPMLLMHLLPFRFVERSGWQRAATWVYFVPNLLALAANLADVIYFRFTLNRTTMAVFREFAHDNAWRFLRFPIDYPLPTLLFGVIALIWWGLYRLFALRPLQMSCRHRLLIGSAAIVAAGTLCFGAVRGGYGDLRPLAPHNAALYCDEPQQQALVLNTPFTLLRTIGKTGMKALTYFPEEEARKYFDAVRRPTTDGTWSARFKGRNVVVIIWESMAKEWVGGLNRGIPGYPSYTPFVDSLLDHSYVFTQAYACGTQSVDAMPALFCSITRPGQPFVTSPYAGNGLTSLPEILREGGYHTAFFHNAENGSMGFDAFARKVRFHEYYGQNEYGNLRDADPGGWGIWDEPFLQFVARKATSFRQPFFLTEFTISSHHPFHVPEQYKGKLPQGPLPIQQCVAYTDLSLRRFFETARRLPWYRNTLFVITADHAVTGVRPEYSHLVGRFSIPFILYDPRGELVGQDRTTLQQADFLPTLLDLLGLQRETVSFGHNVFSPSAPHFAVSSAGEMYQMVQGDYVLHFDGTHATGFYNKATDPTLSRNLAAQNSAQMQEMVRTLKAYLQDFTHRMTENRLRLTDRRTATP